MKNIVVFGGNGNIGQSVCRKLKEDYTVYCADITAPVTTQHFHEFIKCDINNPYSVDKIFERVPRVYGVVNCHYQRHPKYGTVWNEVYDRDFLHFLNVNLINTFALIKQCRLHDVENIVLLSSIYGEKTPEFWIYDGTCVVPCPLEYAVSKAGLNHMVRYLAKAGMHINAVAPGGIESDDMDVQFKENYRGIAPFTDPDNVAKAVSHLMKNTGINGQVITVDNGWSI